MLKKGKKVILILVIILVIIGLFAGIMFLYDQMGVINLEQFGIDISATGSTGYVDGDIVKNMQIVHDYIRKNHFGYAQLGKTLNESTFPTFLDCRNN